MILKRFLKEAEFCCFCAKNPNSGFDAVKWEGKGSVPAAFLLVGLFFLTAALKAQLTGFIFNTQNPDKFSALSVFAVTAGGFAVVFTANYAASSLLPSEATLRQIFITLAYPLAPYIASQAVYIAASNLVAMEMGVFLSFVNLLGIGWAALELIIGMYQTHRLSFPLVAADIALTAFGAVIIVFFMLLLYSLFQQLYTFFYTIFSEIMFRF
ncbi:MAG: hypothetical protein LBS62_12845 [Clostridiales bacterium]|jgi:hypothetical protein|nr:hypothetical protein [Clostridiales bacterium]